MPNKRTYSVHKSNKEKRARFHFSIVILIIMIGFVACFTIYMITSNRESAQKVNSSLSNVDSSETSQITTTEVTTTTVATTPEAINPVPESTPEDFSYIDDCVFIGDSLTVGLSSYGLIPEKNVLANIGLNIDTISNAKITTPDGEIPLLDQLKSISPKNVYIMLGSNGIAWLSNDHMIDRYTNFIKNVQEDVPDSKIYILSIPPVTVNKEAENNGTITNDKIDLYNSDLLKLANSMQLNFVDINTALKGNDGKLPLDYSGKDGMHFKKDTYNIMIDYILNHTVKD